MSLAWTPVTPIPGESLDGLVARFAAANYVDTLRGVLGSNQHYAACRTLAEGGMARLERLAGVMGVAVGDLLDRAYHPVDGVERVREFFGVVLHRTDLERKRRLYAPAALALSPHHRAKWQVRAFPFCTETWQFLVSACSRAGCGRQQAWRRTLGIAHCDECLADLTQTPTAEVAPELRERLAMAAGVIDPDPARRARSLAALPAEVAALGPSGVFELLARLVPVTDPALPHGRDADVWRAPAPRLAAAMAEAWDLATGWPTSFSDLAARRIATADRRYNDGNGGATTRFLRLASDDYVPTLVANLIGALRNSIDLEHPAGGATVARTMDSASTSLALGRGSAVVAGLRRRGALRTVFAHRGGMPIAMFDRAEIEAIRADMTDRSSVETLSWRLGIPNYGVEQMAASGVLQPFGHPYFAARYEEIQLRTSSADRLEERLGELAGDPEAESLAPLRKALHAVGGRLKPWGALMRDLLDGAPFALAAGGRLAERLLIPADRLEWLASLDAAGTGGFGAPAGGMLSKQDAGEVLNLGPKQLMPALAGIFERRQVHKASIPVEDVLSLASAHVTHGELAARSGLSVPRVRAAMRALGHEPRGPLGFDRVAGEKALPRLVEIAAAELRQVDMSEIARRSGLTWRAAERRLRELGVPPTGRHRYDRRAIVAVMPKLRAAAPGRRDRITAAELAARLGVRQQTLPSTMRRLGIRHDGGTGWPLEAAERAVGALQAENERRTRLAGPEAQRRGTARNGEGRRGFDGRYGPLGPATSTASAGEAR